MVCWEVTNITCIVEVFVLLLIFLLPIIVNVSIAIEHAVASIVTIRVHFFPILAFWLHLAAKEIRVDLLVWINPILLVFLWLLHLIIHLVHLLLLHLRILVLHLVWLLFRLVLVVILFRIHFRKLFKIYIS